MFGDLFTYVLYQNKDAIVILLFYTYLGITII